MNPDDHKKYKVRADVHLVEICGTYLLISERTARKECSYVREISESAAFFWELLAEGRNFREIIEESLKYYEITDTEELYDDLEELVRVLRELQYIV